MNDLNLKYFERAVANNNELIANLYGEYKKDMVCAGRWKKTLLCGHLEVFGPLERWSIIWMMEANQNQYRNILNSYFNERIHVGWSLGKLDINKEKLGLCSRVSDWWSSRQADQMFKKFYWQIIVSLFYFMLFIFCSFANWKLKLFMLSY